jgi:hypothetical protein
MANTYEIIDSITLGSDQASVTFSAIPATFTDLKVVFSTRTNRANAIDGLGFYFNGDTTAARYTSKVLIGNGSFALSNSANPSNDEGIFTTGDDSTANTFGNSEIYIPNYAGSNQKSSSIDSVGEYNATTIRMNIANTLYNQTTAISSITFIPITGTTILTNSTFYLYGISNA